MQPDLLHTLTHMSNAQWVEHQLLQAFPDATLCVQDPRQDDQHLAVEIQAAAFVGQTPVACHRMVYAALQDLRGGRLHALSVKTSAPQAPCL